MASPLGNAKKKTRENITRNIREENAKGKGEQMLGPFNSLKE